jgi:hypothetical protein
MIEGLSHDLPVKAVWKDLRVEFGCDRFPETYDTRWRVNELGNTLADQLRGIRRAFLIEDGFASFRT